MSALEKEDTPTEPSTDRKPRYVEAKLEHSSRIKQIRDGIYNEFMASDKYRKIEPHITIIPPFYIPEDNIHEIHQLINNITLDDPTVQVKGASVWQSLNNPRVVLLDVDVDLSQVRTTIQQALKTYDADLIHEPVNAHITLFKCDNGYTIDQTSTDQLRELIWKHRDQWETEITYLDVRI